MSEKDILDTLEYGDLPPLPLPHKGRAEEALQAGEYDVERINRDYAMVLVGGQSRIVKEQPGGPVEDRVRMISVQAFDHWYSNKFTETRDADGKVKTTTWAKAWRSDIRRRQYEGIEFFPNQDGAEATPGYLNLWRGFGVEPSPNGSWGRFRDHLFVNVCQEKSDLFDWVLAWFAHIVQRPRERVGTALVLRGRMGTGKTKVGEVIGSLFPAHYFQVDDPRYIVGQFNAHMAACLLLQAEEAVWAGDKHAEGRLKGLVTQETQMIESKGIDPVRMRNYVRLMMTSNEDWVVPAATDERRFCVLDVHPRCAQNHEYFREMQAELDQGGRARLLYDLMRLDLSKLNLRQVPRTAGLLEQKIRSLDPLDAWWYARLQDGATFRGESEWKTLVRTDALYDDYIKTANEMGVGRKRDKSSFGHRMHKLVPTIDKSRPWIDGERRWCYELGSLADCRQAFVRLVGQAVAWPIEGASECENSDSHPMDDEIPA